MGDRAVRPHQEENRSHMVAMFLTKHFMRRASKMEESLDEVRCRAEAGCQTNLLPVAKGDTL